MVGAGIGTLRVGLCLFGIKSVHIVTPLVYIAAHVVNSQFVRLFLFHGLRSVVAVLAVPSHVVNSVAARIFITAVVGATARGIQLTTKPIARISPSKGPWWDEGETATKGVLL